MRISGRSPCQNFGQSCRPIPLSASGPMTIPMYSGLSYVVCDNVSGHELPVEAAAFEALAADLKSGRVPLDRLTVSEDVQPGLSAIIRRTGAISLHVGYSVGASRPWPPNFLASF